MKVWSRKRGRSRGTPYLQVVVRTTIMNLDADLTVWSRVMRRCDVRGVRTTYGGYCRDGEMWGNAAMYVNHGCFAVLDKSFRTA